MTDVETNDEEILVLVELSGIIDSNFLVEKERSMKILGVETDNPILQLDNYVFTGEYEDFKGTEVIFEEVKGKEGESELKYYGKTTKKLAMKRVFLQTKKSDEDSALTEKMSDVNLSEKDSSADHPST